jgi:DNA replicative helicase MCM subunit Mcm2 (Cdc46/Mcm family)
VADRGLNRQTVAALSSPVTDPVHPEASYVCDSCGEEIVVPIDPSAGALQEYVEDCPVCCSPVVLTVELDERGRPRLRAHPE